MKVLIFTQYFLPAYKAGGPINTIANLVKYVDEDFYIITRDRDLGEKTPFENIDLNKWITFPNYSIYYANKSSLRCWNIASIIKRSDIDLIYLNSFYSYRFSIQIILIKYFGIIKKPLLLAPKGEFSPGFLDQKKYKKKVYIFLSKLFHFYEKIYWHASTEHEKNNIVEKFPKFENNVFIAEDISVIKKYSIEERIAKNSGELKICFISRIHPMKNLLGLVRILAKLDSEIKIQFHIYGPIHDGEYWKQIESKLVGLNKNISWKYFGPIPQEKVTKLFLRYHLLFLPTFGENYGHIILEALSAGCLVLISDRTPWNSINNYNFGRAFNLKDEQNFLDYIKYLYTLDNAEMKEKSLNAMEFAKSKMNNDDKIIQNQKLFESVLSFQND